MKRYSKCKSSTLDWIGDIPENWKISRVKNAFYRKKEKAYEEAPTILSLTSKGVIERDISFNEGQIAESYFEYNPVEIGDLLLNPMDLVTNAFSSVSILKGVISPAYFNLKNKEGIVSRYFDYYFKLQYWSLCFFAHGKGVSTEHRWTLNNETLMNFPIPLPSESEQTAIADYLDKKTSQIDTLIANKQKLIELLKEERTVIINQVVMYGLDPNVKMKSSGIEWIDDIPEHWEVKKLKYIIAKVGSGITPKGGANVYQAEGIPLLRSQNIYNDGLRLEDIAFISEEIDEEMSNSRIAEGDVLLNITGGSIGRCFYVPEGFGTGNVNQHVCILRPLKNKILTRYLHLLIISGYGQTLIDFFQTGANREGLNYQQIKSFNLPLPDVIEQEKIIIHLENETKKVDQTVSKIEKEIDLLQEYRTALISEAVTGKLKVI